MQTKEIDLGNVEPPSISMEACGEIIVPADESFDAYRLAYPLEIGNHKDCKTKNQLLIEAIERYNSKLDEARKR